MRLWKYVPMLALFLLLGLVWTVVYWGSRLVDHIESDLGAA